MSETKQETVTTKAAPVVLSDGIVKQVDVIREQARRIGQLEGEKEVFKQNLNVAKLEFDRRLDESAKKVEIVIKEQPKAVGSFEHPYNKMLQLLSSGSGDIVRFGANKNVEDLTELADAMVKGNAEIKVKAAEEAQKEAEDKASKAEKFLKIYKDKKEEEIENAVEMAERRNLKQIDSLNKVIKNLHAQGNVDELAYSVLEHEHELAIEEMFQKEQLLKKQINLITTPASNIIQKVVRKLQNPWTALKIRRRS